MSWSGTDDLKALIRRCLAGDQAAMLALVERFRGQVFGLCYRMLGHREDAEDAAQETFVRVLKNLHRWDADREFQPWLLAIAGNRCRTALAEQFATFFADTGTFTLGVCNGCQMLSALKDLIPGARHWPSFERNRSEQYEARLVGVEVVDSPSVFFQGMAGSRIPVVVAHGEGRAAFATTEDADAALACMRYVEADGSPTERFPLNPNGSPGGRTGFTSADGRATILMPHPERVFRSVQMSWRPSTWGEDSPWMRMFRNARVWLG